MNNSDPNDTCRFAIALGFKYNGEIFIVNDIFFMFEDFICLGFLFIFSLHRIEFRFKFCWVFHFVLISIGADLKKSRNPFSSCYQCFEIMLYPLMATKKRISNETIIYVYIWTILYKKTEFNLYYAYKISCHISYDSESPKTLQ